MVAHPFVDPKPTDAIALRPAVAVQVDSEPLVAGGIAGVRAKARERFEPSDNLVSATRVAVVIDHHAVKIVSASYDTEVAFICLSR